MKRNGTFTICGRKFVLPKTPEFPNIKFEKNEKAHIEKVAVPDIEMEMDLFELPLQTDLRDPDHKVERKIKRRRKIMRKIAASS